MSIARNLHDIRTSIDKLAREYNRDPATIQLIAVSKVQPEERITEALECGLRVFGENRVQEAQQRWAPRRADYPDLELHLIGPLQTNKAKDAVALFDCIHTLDREKLARALSAEMAAQNKSLPCLIQVNTGAEDQKSGIAPHELSDFLGFCRNDCKLDVTGLMCIPPVDDPPALHFALLRKLARENNVQGLSMGMSGDYEWAVPLDATYIRVGTALFGERVKPL